MDFVDLKVSSEIVRMLYKCKTLTASWGCNSSVMISKCLQCYDVCMIVGSNLEVICPTRIRLHCKTNYCSSNMGSGLELSTTSLHTRL